MVVRDVLITVVLLSIKLVHSILADCSCLTWLRGKMTFFICLTNIFACDAVA